MRCSGRRQHLSDMLVVALACLTLTAEARAQGKAKVEILPQIAHSLGVLSVAFSADGARVVSGSYDKTVKLWDAATGAQLRTFEGHADRVTSVAFSPDGTKVLSGSEDKTLKLWDAATGSLLRTFEGHANGVNSVAFSPDGARVLSGGWDGKLKLWDAATGALQRTFEGQEPISSVAFSPDGALLLSGSRGWWTTKLWDAATGAQLRTFEGHTDDVTSVAFSPDGTKVLSGSEDKTLKLWDAATGSLLRTFEGHANGVNSVAFSPDGASVLSGGRDKKLKLWDAATGALLRTFEGHINGINSVAFSPDGARVLSGGGGMDLRLKRLSKRLGVSDDTVKLWATSTGQLLRTFEGHASEVLSVAFSPDGTRVVTGDLDQTAKVWDATTGALLHNFEGDGNAKDDFDVNGSRVLLVSKTLKQWDITTGTLLRTFKRPPGLFRPLVFSPDGAQVLSQGEKEGSFQLWDLASGALLQTFKGHENAVTSVSFSPDGKRVVSGSEDKMMKLWDTSTGQLLRNFEGHADTVNSVAFSPNGTRVLSGSGKLPSSTAKDIIAGILAAKGTEPPDVTMEKLAKAWRPQQSGGPDDTMKLWDATTGALLRTFDGHSGPVNSVAFSPDGARVFSISRTLQLWDTDTGQLIRNFGDSNKVLSVAFSPDGARLLSGSADNTMKLWDAVTGALLRTFEGHSGAVSSVAFSPDGARALSGSWDRTVRIWSVQRGELLAVMIGEADGEWLAITPKGFFAASRRGTAMLGMVRGLEPFSVMQFYDHLYRPDLIEQLLKGDPEGKYADAASKLNLEKILDFGSVPQIDQIPERKTELINDTAKITVRLTDTGGGIADKVVWRVNGVTQGNVEGETSPCTTSSSCRIATQSLRLDPTKKNLIEVTAYNGAGLLATEPYRIEIDKFGVTSEERPRMYVVAVGVSDYAKTEWHLKYAANDAQTVGDTLKSVARGLYGEPKVVSVLNKNATAKGIEAAINSLQGEVKPSDVFVLYVAGHGRSIAGTYYFLPQDLQFEGGQTIMSGGISQDMLQKWLAKIPAQKSILILDTCESAAARGGDIEQETAIDRLQHATGRSVITAASSSAFEGYQDHGLLTYTILQELTTPEGSGNEEVTLSKLAAYVFDQVPKISQRVFGERQQPHNTIADDFPLGERVAAVTNAETSAIGQADIPKTPTHVLIRAEQVREKAESDAPGERTLSPGTQVRVVQQLEDWSVIAREGEKLGYVPVGALAPLQ